ncbi:MAG: hypothetical protein Q7L55_05095 [Actinomycetota bacterium]|nr:hypothetical protein [Actinomycetota bacterium]
MIALIVLVALSLVIGAVVGATALLVAVGKLIFRAMRSIPVETQPGSVSGVHPPPVEVEQEFNRIISREWPSP